MNAFRSEHRRRWLRPGPGAMRFAVLAATMPHYAWAAHPLSTEDAATQGERVVEVENGLASSRRGPASELLYQPQLSLGVAQTVDLIVQPSWLSTRIDGAPSVRGFGDTIVDLKWRFDEAQPWSLAVRSGLTLATSENGLGIPHRRAGAHAVLVATWSAAPVAVHANVGLAHLPVDDGRRAASAHVSSALVWRRSVEWALLAEMSADSTTERGSRAWPVTVLVGTVRTLHPGTDLDVGYRLSFDRGVTTRVLLLGFTTHFTY